MADRYPLIYNPSANQIQELQSGDSLDVGSSLVKNATGYATSTGTSSQFLKADGSSDSNTYLTSAGTIALAQGLTGSPSITVGAVSGTTGTFSGNVSAVNVSASSSVTAATFYGDGSQLTGIDASALKDGSNVKVQATATGATVTGTLVATVTGDVTGNVTGNITSSGANTLGSLTVSNDATVQGNLTVNGTTTTIDTAVTAVDSLAVDGSVGIGTTGTPEKLTVKGDILIRPSNGNVNTSDLALKFGRTDSHDGDNQQKTSIIATPSGGGWGMHDLHFCLDSSADLNNVEISDSKFVIKNSGNIGINSTAPTGTLDVGGNILPDADNTRDLGSSSKRWANIYTGDLNLSNEGAVNDVDGTWGQYTIQEGENDLFLINRRTGKKYKFNLTEVN